MQSLCATLLLALALGASPPAAPLDPQDGGRQDEADAAYRFLAALGEEGLHARVVAEAQRFLAQHPAHPRAAAARHRLAEALFALARFADAAPHFGALLEQGFELAAECALRLGECRLALGDARAAATALERALASEGAYLHAHAAQLLGEARASLGELPAAEAAYERALELDPAPEVAALARRGLAWCALRAGAHAAAQARAQNFLARHAADPHAAELHFVLGAALQEQGRAAEALEAYGRVPAAGELGDGALRGAAFALLALGRPLDAARTFAELLERHPGSPHAPEAARHRAAALLAAGEASQALAALEHPAAGTGGEVRLLRARALAAQGRHEGALGELDRALGGSQGEGDVPSELSTRLRIARGEVLLALGREGEAARTYERAGGVDALLLAALVSSNAGQHAEAERLARAVLASPVLAAAGPGVAARARLVLGEALLADGRPAEAARELEQAASAFGADERALALRARSRQAWALHLAGDHPGAARGFAQIAALEGEEPEIAEAGLLAARALLASDRSAEARAALVRQLERHPTGERAAEALFLLAGLGEGTAELERLLAEHPHSPLRAAAWLELAERWMAAGEHGRAIGAQRALLAQHALEPGADAARYGLAWCLRACGEPAQAARELLPLLERDEGLPAELRAAALELAVWCRIESADAPGAERALRAFAALTAGPQGEGPAGQGAFAALLSCARATARALAPQGEAGAGRPSGAARAQALLAELAAGCAEPRVRAELLLEGAWIALEQGDLETACERAAEVLAVDAQSSDGLELLYFAAQALEERGELRAAAELFGRASEPASPLAPEALYKQGFAWLGLDEHRLAAESFRALCARHAGHELEGEARYLAGEALYRAGDVAGAALELAAYRARHPRHQALPRALFRLGLSLARLERHAEAAAVLAELGRAAPDFEARAEAELWRGRSLVRTGDERGARRALANVLARDRGQQADRARIDLGRLELDGGRPDEGLSHLLKVALLSSHADEVAEASWLAGRCLEALGEPEQALARYEKLLREQPQSPFAPAARERAQALRPQRTTPGSDAPQNGGTHR